MGENTYKRGIKYGAYARDLYNCTYQSGTFSKQLDEIVTESPITIKLNGEEYVTVVCTPNYIEDMVIGF